jgi:hypothetical protein
MAKRKRIRIKLSDDRDLRRNGFSLSERVQAAKVKGDAKAMVAEAYKVRAKRSTT